jgi:hypothetical protein
MKALLLFLLGICRWDGWFDLHDLDGVSNAVGLRSYELLLVVGLGGLHGYHEFDCVITLLLLFHSPLQYYSTTTTMDFHQFGR